MNNDYVPLHVRSHLSSPHQQSPLSQLCTLLSILPDPLESYAALPHTPPWVQLKPWQESWSRLENIWWSWFCTASIWLTSVWNINSWLIAVAAVQVSWIWSWNTLWRIQICIQIHVWLFQMWLYISEGTETFWWIDTAQAVLDLRRLCSNSWITLK